MFECPPRTNFRNVADTYQVDCAAMYRNEKPAGKAILDSGIPREDVFYTSKVYQPALTYVSRAS